MIGRIRDEGLNRSQAMDTLFWLTDVYGPRRHRLAGDPAGQRVDDEEVHRVGPGERPPGALDFGKGWSLVRFSAHLTEPQVQPIIGFPQDVVVGHGGHDHRGGRPRATIASDADFARYRGKLEGKIVLAQPARAVRMLEGPFILRMERHGPRKRQTTPVPAAAAAAAAAAGGRRHAAGSAEQLAAVLQQRRRRRRSSIAAATATRRPAAAT